MGDAGNSLPPLPPLEALPVPKLTIISEGLLLLEPLSRRGYGPGMILLTAGAQTSNESIAIKDGVPTPLIKWAEEGFVVFQVQESGLRSDPDTLRRAIEALQQNAKCEPKEKIGLVAYDCDLWNTIQPQLALNKEIAGTVIYTSAADFQKLAPSTVPSVQHVAGNVNKSSKLPRTLALTAYEYTSAKSKSFCSPTSPDYDYSLEAVSHTQNLTFFKRHDILDGPRFDLEAIWDEHTYYEFENRSVEHTMATMVQEPYVNHIPTITGGIGRKDLTEFYTNHFIFSNPDDTQLELISRTVGIDRVVDEFIYKFTHDRMIPWLMPGVPPTGVKVEVPMMAVVNIRGDRLYHEHISWDQGTVLRQVGILGDYLPWTRPAPDAKYISECECTQANGLGDHALNVRVPVGGMETAAKMREKNSVKSNGMFAFQVTKV